MNIKTSDARFPTDNTNLASCLGALRIPIKQEQPVYIRIDGDTGARKVFYFFEPLGHEFLGKTFSAAQLEKDWRNRAEIESKTPDHPLVSMRAVLDKNDWLTKVWHGKIVPTFIDKPEKFRTDDQSLAACIMASGTPLLRLDKPDYVFGQKPPKGILESFLSYRDPNKEGEPVALMRRALEVRKLLIELCKRPDCVPIVHYTNGNPELGGSEAAIPLGTPAHEVDELLSILYSR